MTLAKGFTVAAEHVRHFEPEPAHRSELRKASVASPPVRWGRAAAADRADWRWRRPYWWRFEDIEPWCSDFDDQAATEWSAHRCPIRANGQQRRVEANGE